MPLKTIFLDRDGVINKDVNYLYKIDEFIFIDGVIKTCQLLNNLGYRIIIITNQSGIGRGYFTENDFQILTQWMLKQFQQNNIQILDLFHCPHSPKQECYCRKPKPGMFNKAKAKYNIDMEKSWMIGDSERDIEAAKSAGINNTILVRSGQKIDESKSNAKFFIESIHDSINIIDN